MGKRDKTATAAAAAAVVQARAKSPAQARRAALTHFAAVLANPGAAAARKDKAARLILTHSQPTAKARRPGAAPVDKGKKEQQRTAASEAAANPGKWTGLLQ